MWYIHIMEYYPATKKNKIMPFVATWMDLEIKKKDKYNIISITCGILKKKKKGQMNLQTEIDSQT